MHGLVQALRKSVMQPSTKEDQAGGKIVGLVNLVKLILPLLRGLVTKRTL
jgi:hypothetical protein